MILTEYIEYRGKREPLSVLSKSSNKKVEVKCPDCEEVRVVMYKSICKAGHYKCLKCVRKMKREYLNIGDKYGLLTIMGHSKTSGHSLCECDCGKEVVVYNYNITIGKTKSCGCLKSENFKDSEKVKDEKHGRWKGGKSKERERFMQTAIYKNWRASVFERDKYTCQICSQVGYDLNAHHIKNYADNKDCRVDIDNGVTLCKKCHNKFHKFYGRINNTKQQFESFIKIT